MWSKSSIVVNALAMVTTIPLTTLGSAYMSSSSVTTTRTRSAFLGASSLPMSYIATTTTTTHPKNAMRMDIEHEMNHLASRYTLEQVFLDSGTLSSRRSNIEAVEAEHGMPWKSSIDPKVTDEELLYMPFWEWQMEFMKTHLTNLEIQPCTNGERDFSFKENTQKKARIVNLCFRSDEYRKIRMTYNDAGENTQVFNAVWYPDPQYNLPVLGIDILAFNRKKYLAIVDFQPLHEDEADHAVLYEHTLKPIKERYENLKGRMSAKFYDETQFFSQQMLFARFEDESIIQRELFPAFQSYVKTHLDLLRQTSADRCKMDFVLERQQAYDTYSAERDPATGLFTAMFGADWAQAFVHDFLFSMSERTVTTTSSNGAALPMLASPTSRSVPQQQQQAATASVTAAPDAGATQPHASQVVSSSQLIR